MAFTLFKLKKLDVIYMYNLQVYILLSYLAVHPDAFWVD